MIHPVDLSASMLVANGPSKLRFFKSGWGDPAKVDLIRPQPEDFIEPDPISLDWGPPEVTDEYIKREAVFDSDSPGLEGAATQVEVRLIEPLDPSGKMCLLMAGWNEDGLDGRMELARQLALKGIGSVMAEHPFYGSRRVIPPPDQPVRTVADFSVMGRAAVREGRAILGGLSDDYELGVSGYSMGGNLAAVVAALTPFNIAAAPLAASHAPAPNFLEGALRRGVDWKALGGLERKGDLYEVLEAPSVLRMPVPDHVSSAVIVSARSDGFVPASSTAALHRHWRGSELRVLPGGHATVWWWRKEMLVQAIVDSFDRVN